MEEITEALVVTEVEIMDKKETLEIITVKEAVEVLGVEIISRKSKMGLLGKL